MAIVKKNNKANEELAVVIRQSIETELGSMQTRTRLAIGNCNRIKDQVPEAIEWKQQLLMLELKIHNAWQDVATAK